MMDLLEFSVSQWLLISRRRGISIDLNIDIEDVALETLRRTKRGKEECSLEWLRGRKELDWEVLLCL